MKIHIVQKGDTLWELAKQYGVDFNELKEANAHLSSPDMIMPGMKIKIPSSSKQVKKKTTQVKTAKKETKKQVKEQPKPFSPKPLAVKEDDHLKQKEVKQVMPKQELKEAPKMPAMPQIPQMPPMMQMPIMEQHVQQHTEINIPTPKQAVPKSLKAKPIKKPAEKPMKEKVESKQEVPQMMPMPLPIPQMPTCYQPMPMCCHAIPSCCCHHHGHQPMMHHMAKGNCCGMDHMYMNSEMSNWYGQPATMPAQTEQYEGHNAGLYNYNMQEEQMAPANFGNNQHYTPMQQQTQPYPPFYRSTPESPPNPTPPSFPSMPVFGVDEEDHKSEND